MSLEGQNSGRLPLIIGHRGACAFAPENTLASFEVAFRGGADGIEFDVRLARDGVPVVIHDPTLIPTAQVPGTVESHDSAFLTRLNAGAWFNEQNPELAFEEFAGEVDVRLALRARLVVEVDQHRRLQRDVLHELHEVTFGVRSDELDLVVQEAEVADLAEF